MDQEQQKMGTMTTYVLPYSGQSQFVPIVSTWLFIVSPPKRVAVWKLNYIIMLNTAPGSQYTDWVSILPSLMYKYI